MLGLGLGLEHKRRTASSSLLSRAGGLMHLDVTDLLSSTVIKDKAGKGNHATMYNFSGTAASGIQNNEYNYPWATRTSAADNAWTCCAYGGGIYAALSYDGGATRAMSSPDGITWTIRTSAAANQYTGLCYGNGLFVGVSGDGVSRVATSSNGTSWTGRTAAAANIWRAVCYGNGVYVAVGISGTGNRAMYSADGTSWNIGSGTPDNGWRGVAYGAGLFVAVAYSGAGNRVMTSPDGATWTARDTTGKDLEWRSVTFGNGLFVATADSGTGQRVMTSPDGIDWTLRSTPADLGWRWVTYGDGVFVAVADTGVGNRCMTSFDGISWTLRATAGDTQGWQCVSYGADKFFAVANSGVGIRVMTMVYNSVLGTGSRPCIRGDGVDDYLRVLSPSTGTAITSQQFALAMTLYSPTTTLQRLLNKNDADAATIQYGMGSATAGRLDFYLNGSSRLQSPAASWPAGVWGDIVMHRATDNTITISINGTVIATASYATALTLAANLLVFARSSAADGSAATMFSACYANNISMYAGEDATLANIKLHRTPITTKYGITYAA